MKHLDADTRKHKIGEVEPCTVENRETHKRRKLWDVITETDGSGVFFESEEHARIFSELIQIKHSLKNKK